MSTFAVSVDRQATQTKAVVVSPWWQLAVVVVLAELAVFPATYFAWSMWTSDPLRSVGMFFPVACVLFLIQGWRRCNQPLRGTPWGLVPMVASLTVIWIHEHCAVHLFLSRTLEVDPLPVGLSLALMGAGVLLMLGGIPLLRTLIVPVVLLGLVNPVPHAFARFDLPLQQISATAARNFANLIGEHPTGAQLQLMFTPNFGMFIAPGCDGIRGAITLGYLGLFAAMWRRFTVTRTLLLAVAGVATGYVFNLVRLVTLVLYYKAGQSFPSIQPYGTQVDYAIGGTLFLLVSYAFGRVIFRGNQTAAQDKRDVDSGPRLLPSQSFTRNMVVCMLICGVPALMNVYTMVRNARQARLEAETRRDLFPERVGPYHLVTKWNELSDERIMVYRWARYSDGNPAHDVSLGLWLLRGEHDPRYCHVSRGERLYPQPEFVHQIQGRKQFRYVAYSYDDGTNDVLLASSRCEMCQAIPDRRFGPLKIVSTEATTYFRMPDPHNAVVLHTAPRLTTTPAEIRQPIDTFLSHLDETAFLTPETPTP